MRLEQPLKTERLVIRRFVAADWQDLHAYLSDERVVRYAPYGVHSVQESKDAAIRRAESQESLAVCLKDSGRLIGNLYLGVREYQTLELGFQFNPAFWHLGYATESTRALIDHVFARGAARRIVSRCNPDNIASWQLLERLHMRREGRLKLDVYMKVDADGQALWEDTYLYAVLATEWAQTTGEPKAQ